MTSLSRNILYNIAGQTLLIVLSFVAVKYIFQQLGEDALGIIYFTAMLNSLICLLLERGVCFTIVREVSSHIGADEQYIHDLSRTSSLLYWGFYLLLALGLYLLAPVLVVRWINLQTMAGATAIEVVRVLGISSLLALPKSLYVSLLRGIQRMEFNNGIDILTSLFQQFGTIFILIFGGHIYHVIYWFAVCYVLGILAYLFVCAHFFSFRALAPGYNSQIIKSNLEFASKMLFISITGAIHLYADKLFVSKILPIAIFGYYGFAYSVISKGALVTSAISQAALPSFSRLFQDERKAELLVQYQRLQDLLCYGIVPIFAGIFFVKLPFFTYLLNEDAANMLLIPTALLCLGFFLNGTLSIPYVFSLAVGRPEITVRQHLYDLFVTLPATIFLVYYAGLVGASLSLVLLYSFAYIYSVPRYCRECLQMPLWQWYKNIIKIFCIILMSFGFTWLMVNLSGTKDLGLLILAYLVGLIIFGIGTYFGLNSSSREYVRQFFNSCRRIFFQRVRSC